MCPNKVEPKSVQEICCLYLKDEVNATDTVALTARR